MPAKTGLNWFKLYAAASSGCLGNHSSKRSFARTVHRKTIEAWMWHFAISTETISNLLYIKRFLSGIPSCRRIPPLLPPLRSGRGERTEKRRKIENHFWIVFYRCLSSLCIWGNICEKCYQSALMWWRGSPVIFVVMCWAETATVCRPTSFTLALKPTKRCVSAISPSKMSKI